MNKLWIRNGKFVSDEYGRPLVCPICPCSTCEEKIEWLRHLATVYGGTFYGEGYIRTPDIEELVAPAVEVFQAAMIYAITVNEVTTRYIITVGCGEDCPLGKRILYTRESYIEKDGVCECPSLATFIENAEFAGYEVFGESILIRFVKGIVSYKKCAKCYYDVEASTWRYFDCASDCVFGAFEASVRQDFACDGCVDERELILAHQSAAGVVAYQYGSHTCYKWTIDDVVSRTVVMHGGNGNNGGGYVDYRWLVLLVDYGGKRWLVNYYVDDYYPKLRWDSTEVQNNTVLDGYANLLKYTRNDDGSDIGIPGDTYGTYLVQNYETEDFYTEEEAIAFSNTESAFETGAASVFNYFQLDLESIDKRTPVCDYDIIGNFVRHLDYGEKRWRASNKGKYGIIYSFRALETNRGFLLLDGTYITEIYQPTLSEVQTCADYSTWEYEHSHWDEGVTRELEHGIGAKDDPICEEIDPEEFE